MDYDKQTGVVFFESLVLLRVFTNCLNICNKGGEI